MNFLKGTSLWLRNYILREYDEEGRILWTFRSRAAFGLWLLIERIRNALHRVEEFWRADVLGYRYRLTVYVGTEDGKPPHVFIQYLRTLPVVMPSVGLPLWPDGGPVHQWHLEVVRVVFRK